MTRLLLIIDSGGGVKINSKLDNSLSLNSLVLSLLSLSEIIEPISSSSVEQTEGYYTSIIIIIKRSHYNNTHFS